jgi:hypothetical protein
MKQFVLLFVVVVIEALLHYIPWRLIMRGRREELPRVVAYTLGVLGMMGPFTVWLWDLGDIETIHTLWKVIGVAGMTVLFLYWFDHNLDLEMKDIESTEREQHGKSQEGK